MSVRLVIDNINTFVEGSFDYYGLDKELSFYVPGFFKSKLFNTCRCGKRIDSSGRCSYCGKGRIWDGRKHLLLKGRGTPYFPTGCLSIVVDFLTKSGKQIDYKFNLDQHDIDPSLAFSVSLNDPKDTSKTRYPWDHQQQAIFSSLKYKRGIIQAPTSAGKTTIMAAITKILQKKTVILIDKKTIAFQLREEISAMLGEEVGLIQGKTCDVRRVTVAMTQSLANKTINADEKDSDLVRLVEETEILLLDECHHASSATWYSLAKSFKNAQYRIGVTGTALLRSNGDDLLLIGATGGIIYEIPEQELIKQEKVARPVIHLYTIKEPKLDQDLNYQKAYLDGVVQNDQLNRSAANLINKLYSQNNQTLVLLEKLEHIENLEKFLAGVEYKVLTGKTPDDILEQSKNDFKEGKLKIIIATKIFDEGVSIDNIDWIIRLGCMKTKTKTKQQVGRGQRLKKGKPNIVHIVDYIMLNHKYLIQHSLARYEMYKSLGYEIILEQ